MSSRWSKRFACGALLTLVLVVAACSQAVATPAATSPSAGAPLTVVVSTNATLGKYLTDAKGMALYFYTPDTTGKSNCSGGCLATWPALTVPKGTTPTGGVGVTGKLGTITRDDGSIQVTINDLPLYYYAQDQAAGDVKGQGVGGIWYISDPTGKLIK